MSTPLDDHSDLRYAEYVLGVLDADSRASVEREIASSEAAAVAVELWRRRLLPLAEEIVPREPPPHLWPRIRTALQLDMPAGALPPATRPTLPRNLRFWHWLSFATTAVAAACIVALILITRHPAAPAATYMASTLAQKDGHAGWTATVDIERARLIVVPAAPQSLAAGRAPELWLIAKGGKPIAVGMISASRPVILPLGPALRGRVSATAVLAVSVEPPGGSLTGQPTGPVIATGTIAGA
jgi:anti-sigma-K factor RskA